MLHPILAQKKIFYAYLSGWFILFLVHTGFLYNHDFLNLKAAITDAFIYNFVLMILTLALYFPLAYPEDCTTRHGFRKSFIYHLFHHAITLAVTLIIWLGSSFMLSQLILSQNQAYMHFARTSLPIRGAIGALLLILLISMYHFIAFYKHLEEKKHTRKTQKICWNE